MFNSNVSKNLFLVMAAVTFAVVLGVAFSTTYASAKQSETTTVVDWAYQGSVTACFEQKAVANEIEISKSAIERATRKVMGFANEIMPAEEASPEVCGMKLA